MTQRGRESLACLARAGVCIGMMCRVERLAQRGGAGLLGWFLDDWADLSVRGESRMWCGRGEGKFAVV